MVLALRAHVAAVRCLLASSCHDKLVFPSGSPRRSISAPCSLVLPVVTSRCTTTPWAIPTHTRVLLKRTTQAHTHARMRRAKESLRPACLRVMNLLALNYPKYVKSQTGGIERLHDRESQAFVPDKGQEFAV